MRRATRPDDARLRAGDAEARRLAQSEFVRPVMIEAGAGTGKTAIAVERIVVWSLGPGWERWERWERRERGERRERQLAGREGRGLGRERSRPDAARAPDPEDVAREVLSRVVAITFTEAAAAEMGTRVGQALVALARDEIPVGFDPAALPPSGPERRTRVRALLGALDQLVVRTIHAFCRRLLAEHPLELDLHPRFAVDADGRALEAAAREVMEEALPELATSEEAALLAARGIGPAELEGALLELGREAVPLEALEADPLASELIAALGDRTLAALDAFLEAEGGHIAGATRAPAQAEAARRIPEVRERVARLGDGADLEALASLVSWLEALRQERDVAGALAKWGKGEIRPSVAKHLEGDRLERVVATAGPAGEALAHLGALDPQKLAAAQRLLAPLARRLQERLRRRGVMTFAGLLRGARRLLESGPEVGRQVRRRIDQLLVDEFQDTDATQCVILRRLVLEAPAEERPGLFLVGDPKQSIYGWRDADLAAYDRFRAEVGAAGGEIRSLVVNHRSVPAVLAEVERVVAPSMRPEPEVQPGFEPLLASPERAASPAAHAEPWAAVEYWVSCAWDGEAGTPGTTRAAEAAALEARALAADLVRLHREQGVAWREMGLLFRGTGDLEVYLEQLRRAAVPFVVEGDRSFYARREIVEAAALVRAVLDPRDQLALLAVLRSAWVGVPDAALIPLWARGLPDRAGALGLGNAGEDPADHREARASLRAMVAAAARELPSGIPGLEAVAGWEETLVDALHVLATLRRSFETDPGDVFVEKLRSLPVLEATEGARYLGAFRVANLDRFFRGLAAALAAADGDAGAVLRALREDVSGGREAEEGRPPEAAEDAVQVLTIHKAKGLAFRHVYVVQLHKESGGRGRRVLQPREEPGGWEVPWLGAPSLGDDRLAAREHRVRKAEAVRTLYVAMTRARERLVLLGRPTWAAGRSGGESHMTLVEARDPPLPDLREVMARCAREGRDRVDAAGARWVFPALAAAAAGSSRARREPLFPDPGEVEDRARALARHREAARATARRPFHGAVSRRAHECAVEARREARLLDAAGEDEPGSGRMPAPGEPGGPGEPPRLGDRAGEGAGVGPGTGERDAAGERRTSAAVGTAVHRALELLDPALDPDAARERARPVLVHALGSLLPPPARAAALARAEVLLAGFLGGPLGARWRALAPAVVARELPVLLPPPSGSGDGPTGFVSGTVDLLYRDPESGELVVADYKTDRIAGPADLEARTRDYTAQGAGYVEAVAEALGLPAPPRFELWFLEAGEIRAVSFSGGPAAHTEL